MYMSVLRRQSCIDQCLGYGVKISFNQPPQHFSKISFIIFRLLRVTFLSAPPLPISYIVSSFRQCRVLWLVDVGIATTRISSW